MKTLLPDPPESKGSVWVVDWMGYSLDYGTSSVGVTKTPCRAIFGTEAGANLWAEQIREAGVALSVWTQPTVMEVRFFE